MKSVSKFVVVLILMGLIAAFFSLNLHEQLTFASIKAKQSEFQDFYKDHALLTVAIYMAVYITTTALSLPGAALLTLLGGALFGLGLGLVVVSFASTIGATFAFIAARFLLRDWVQKRFATSLRDINDRIKKEGAFYLFTLRLIPVVPFFVINLVMGLTPIRTLTFFIVSQIGMLPGTLVYVNAGTQLGELQNPSGILSLELLTSFVLLGIFPLLAKNLILPLSRNFASRFKARKLYRNYKRPASFDYNIVVIGGGSAGLVTAYIAAAAKAKVALIEKHKMGGDCLNTGCVPSKTLIRTAKFLHDVKKSEALGIKRASVEFEFADIMARVQKVIKTIEPHDSVERYRSLGVECFTGVARILSPYEVEVNGKILTTKNIVIATGARPFMPPLQGLKDMDPLNSDTLWDLREQPKRLLVLGGGPIGLELAQSFNRLGSEVTVIERGPRVLANEDDDVAEWVKNKLESEGVTLLTNHEAVSFTMKGDHRICVVKHNENEKQITFDRVLVALGRRANVSGFGLEELGIELNENGTVKVDPYLRTKYPNIYACGDVAGPYQFTHTASHQAWFCAVNAMVSPFYAFEADYRVIPWCTYVDPEVARVGLSENEARKKGIAYEVSHYSMEGHDRALTEEAAEGYVKVLTVPGNDKILGVTIIGLHAGDWIAEYVAAMKHGFGMNKILGTIHIYPTLAEANKSVAGRWKQAHVSPRSLDFARKFNQWQRR